MDKSMSSEQWRAACCLLAHNVGLAPLRDPGLCRPAGLYFSTATLIRRSEHVEC